MANVDWYIEGVEFGNCNCDYGCPCQFESLPSEGHCRGFEVLRIDKGHFGDVKLDGLCAAILYAWPGPIFEGNGEMLVIVDERADESQRDALIKVLHGEETLDEATHWWVFRAMSSTAHKHLVKPIEFEIDVEARTARVSIPGVLESTGRPIKSPATGEEHRVRIDIPNGIEFELAEVGSATTKAGAAIKLDIDDRYGQFNKIRHSGSGVVH
ncbi:MAG: DUF1326 domain-containing protein [Alphaproteobacteria bacterium]|nr:DUF1326 domain-containing protein [Alphaproteobacteria bacterium]